jgi:membrane associated rhomboid family serine protease
MIPIRDTLPSRRIPWVMWVLLALNAAAFIQELRAGPRIDALLSRFAVIPVQWQLATPSDLWDWPRLFLALVTAQFLHAGWLHLGANMLYLWIFGNNVEDRLGHARFLLLYLGAGVAAAVSQVFVTPNSAIPMVGASGAIAGVLGAYLLLFPSARVITLIPLGLWWETIEMPAFLFLGLWFLLQWAEGLSTIGQVADVGGVAFWAHIGGFVSGMIGAVVAAPRRRSR